MNDSWRGIFVIVVTPFTEGYELDEASLRKEIRFCIEAGAHGLVGPANASEFSMLSDDERKRWIEIVVSEAGKQIPAVHGGDVTWTQRLESAQVVPIKKMAFETLEPTQGFKRAEIALHQIVDGDVTKIICRHGRQHRQPDVRW